ncbi:hypothetical protein ACS0TY_003682 [Phlomoides rotata]
MRMYIKFIDERAWRSILIGWEPLRTSTDEDNVVTIKRELDWTADEITTTNFKSIALNVIFGTVDISMFKIISNCISAKDAWDRLQEHCEGSESVRRTKLKMLGTEFENLRMKDDENTAYSERISEIANESHSLGDLIPNVKLVHKLLHYVPKRFDAKICVVEKTKNTDQLSLNELVSILKTYEMNTGQVDDTNDGKNEVMFKGETSSSVQNQSFVTEMDSDEDVEDLCYDNPDHIALHTKKFNSFFRKKMNKSKGSIQPKIQINNITPSLDKSSFQTPSR